MKRIKTYYFWQRTKAVHAKLGKLMLLCAFVLLVIGNIEIVKVDSYAVGCYTGIVQFKFVNLGIAWLNLMFGKDLILSYYAMEHLKARKSPTYKVTFDDQVDAGESAPFQQFLKP
eukprot:410605_1